MALNAEFKAKWVKALRSGEYLQADGYLHDRSAYCCLGVACRLLGVSVAELDRYQQYEDCDWYPALATVGLEEAVAADLAHLNDGSPIKKIEPHTFAAIADYIEAKL